jgi:hypothetical protein
MNKAIVEEDMYFELDFDDIFFVKAWTYLK